MHPSFTGQWFPHGCAACAPWSGRAFACARPAVATICPAPLPRASYLYLCIASHRSSVMRCRPPARCLSDAWLMESVLLSLVCGPRLGCYLRLGRLRLLWWLFEGGLSGACLPLGRDGSAYGTSPHPRTISFTRSWGLCRRAIGPPFLKAAFVRARPLTQATHISGADQDAFLCVPCAAVCAHTRARVLAACR